MAFFLFCIHVSDLWFLQGHRLKNSKCKLFREMKRIPMANKLLLTGTPLQNNLAELWSLLNFILPDIFSSHQEFESWYDSQNHFSWPPFPICTSYICHSICSLSFQCWGTNTNYWMHFCTHQWFVQAMHLDIAYI
jgi:hypothetical protein